MNGITTILAVIPDTQPHWLEQLSWGANIVLALAAIFAVWQVFAAIKQAKCALEQNRISLDQLKVMASQLEVARADILLRSKREAISVALDQCKRFAEQIVPRFDEITQRPALKGYQHPPIVDAEFPVISEIEDPISMRIWRSEIELRTKIVQSLNELESFAMYFANELADESVAFPPTGEPFCHICESYRFFIGSYRQPDNVKLYQNIVKLYGMWKPRLERTVLEEQGKVLEARKQKLPADKKGIPIGTVL